MTRARSLKQTIRARAAKTGERYTTARRQVLKELSVAAASHPHAVGVLDTGQPQAATRSAPDGPEARAAVPAHAEGSVSDAMALKQTGHGLAHWFALLDRFGGIEKGHTASARHLHDDHGVDGWYAQGITVAYERARGVRALHQRMSGDYEVSVTKTVTGDTRAVARRFTQASARRRWLAHADADLVQALERGLAAPGTNGVVIRADGQGRFRYRWGSTTVQFHLLPKSTDRTTVVVTHMKLSAPEDVERRRTDWRAVLAALAAALAA